CGQRHRIPTEAVEIGHGAVSRLPSLVEGLFPSGPVLLVTDPNTYAAGEVVAAILEGQRRTEVFVFPVVGDVLSPDEGAVAQVQAALLNGFTCAVAVGAGTINDIVKLAAARLSMPYGVVATAASMNGYTSCIAAIYSRGLKRAIPASPPAWVVGDVDILATAPRPMWAAGLADLQSRTVSFADYLTASWLAGEYYCPATAELLHLAGDVCREIAPRVAVGDPAVLPVLFGALILAGFAMTLAGSSAPASGGEHLIAHLWGMWQRLKGKHENLHGAQVGVATLITAALWEALSHLPRPDHRTIGEMLARRPSLEEEHLAIRRTLGSLAPYAIEEYNAKRMDDKALAVRLHRLAETWDEFWRRLRKHLRPASEIRSLLRQAGAPTTLKELGYPQQEARLALLGARYTRARYTVLDLAADLGVLDDLAPKVLEKSGVLE
ncbi:MAG: sn-glycerol-1-phosphate dehydrogenase, partial [Armatimonadetes bacterium]|nr:sn-glycerol-1-phosphate dehydrogenase [Armatimonadota bacterium]